MPQVFHLSGPEKPALAAADRELGRGGLVVLPTDTVYGLAARPDVPGATDMVFRAKHRHRGLTLPVLVASARDVDRVAVLNAGARKLADRFWPGPLTVVLRRTQRSLAWELGGREGGTVGVRVPDHEVARALLAMTGPLAVTSANPSGEPTPQACDDVRAALGDAVAVYLCAGSSSGDTPSTVVDLTAPDPRILREGAVPARDVFDALRGGRRGPAETRC